jgi:hypothetical protein
MSAMPETKNFATPSDARTIGATRLRRLSHVLAIAAALTVAACTGGAGLDMQIGPVDHSCPNNNSCGGHR